MLAVVGRYQFEVPAPFNVAVPFPASTSDVAPLMVGCCTPLLLESVIVPLATTGVPEELVESWYVPVTVACALFATVMPPDVMFAHTLSMVTVKITFGVPLMLVLGQVKVVLPFVNVHPVISWPVLSWSV